jgi:hypothetical protein
MLQLFRLEAHLAAAPEPALIIESLKRSFAKPFGLDSRRFVIRPAILALNCGKT